MKSSSQHSFAQIPKVKINRSSFDRIMMHKTTFNSGYLIPIYVDNALPGDTFNLKMTSFARLATPITPLMDTIRISTFFFAVPYRLVWSNFKRFMGEQPNPNSSVDFLIPQCTPTPVTGYTTQSIFDYFGLPVGIPDFEHSALPLRAYNLIYNEWFRDQNLQGSLTVNLGDGPDLSTDYSLKRRGKRHDYFTSCLPFPQKGPDVELPLGTSAPIRGMRDDGTITDDIYLKQTTGFARVTGTAGTGEMIYNGTVAPTTDPIKWQQEGDSSGGDRAGWNFADLSEASAAVVNTLRQAIALQQLYERDARGGTRYTEIIVSHFGVHSPDARLQRPEYLGGSTKPVNFHPIAQTSQTTEESPQGNLAALGTFTQGGDGFVKSFTEHTIIIGLASVSGQMSYQYGLDRMWSYRTKVDFFWPTLEGIGEQAVLNKEIYCQNDSVVDDGEIVNDQVFGYQERYAELRYKNSMITGYFRSQAPTSLDIWHIAQKYDSLPTLSTGWIEENPPIQRIVAVENPYPEFLWDSYFKITCARPMKVYSIPGLTRF